MDFTFDWNVLINATVFVGGAFFWKHFNSRISKFSGEVAKIEAVSKKIDEVVDQQKKLTRATEEVKSDIAHMAWNKKEFQTIKREKLELYLEQVSERSDELASMTALARQGESIGFIPLTQVTRINSLQLLYLPELKNENNKFTNLLKKIQSASRALVSEVLDRQAFDSQMKQDFEELGGIVTDINYVSREIIEGMFEPIVQTEQVV